MGTPVFYKFYLTKADGTYYYLSNGLVLESATPKQVKDAPAEWDDTKIQWLRSEKYHGIFRMLTNSYSFVNDGAQILRYLFYNSGYNADCVFRVDQRYDSPTGYAYKTLYQGSVYFINYEDSLSFFKVSILEGGLKSILKSNENTPYLIPIDSDAINVFYDGVFMKGTYHYELNASPDLTEALAGLSGTEEYMFNLATFNTINEGNFPVAITNNTLNHKIMATTPAETFLNGTDTPYKEYIFQAQQDLVGDLFYKARIRWDSYPSAGTLGLKFHLDVVVAKEDGAFSQRYPLYVSSTYTGATGLTTRYEDIDASTLLFSPLIMSQGARIYLLFFIEQSGTGNVTQSYRVGVDNETDGDAVKIHFDVTFRTSGTLAKAFRWYMLFQKHILKMTNGLYTGYSAFLSNPSTKSEQNYPYSTVVLPGDSLRGFTDVNMAVQLDDLFKDSYTRWQTGLGVINDQVRIEQLSYFYDKDYLIADLGEVSELKLSAYQEKIGNKLIIGYDYSDNDTLNGRDNYNTSTTYQFPFDLESPKEIDFKSPYKAGIQEIEDIRINAKDKVSTNNEGDNELFLTTVDRVPFTILGNVIYGLYRPEPDGTVTGIEFPATAYNVDITPGWNLRRNMGYFNSINYPTKGNIAFRKSERNSSLTSQFKTSPTTYSFNMIEKADVPITDEGLLFLPIVAKFKSRVPINLSELLDINPYGFFRFSYQGRSYDAFMLDAAMVPSQNSEYDWQMILTLNNEIKNYIR